MLLTLRQLGPLLLLLTVGCGDREPTTPQLELRPVALGGPHEQLLEAALGELQAYRIRYRGPFTSYRVVTETIEDGQVVATEDLIRGSCRPDVDMLLGLITLAPRRDGEGTELTLVVSVGGGMLHRDAHLDAWDALKRSGEATTIRAWNEPASIGLSDGEPVVLWRWCHGEYLPLNHPLTAPPPDDVRSVMQVTITFRT